MIDKEYAISTLRTMEYDFDSERVAIDMAIKALENERPKSKWVIDKNIDENGDYHCKNCKAIIEKDEWARHNYYYCYHCGADMRESEVELDG